MPGRLDLVPELAEPVRSDPGWGALDAPTCVWAAFEALDSLRSACEALIFASALPVAGQRERADDAVRMALAEIDSAHHSMAAWSAVGGIPAWLTHRAGEALDGARKALAGPREVGPNEIDAAGEAINGVWYAIVKLTVARLKAGPAAR